MKKQRVLLAIALVFALTATAFAAQTEKVKQLSTVEVTGSRIADDISEVPAETTVITRQEIENSGARDLQDILERVPGINAMKNNASMALQKSFIIRGLNTEVLLLVDGVPFMTSDYGTGPDLGSPLDLRNISLSEVERIEIVKGAGSALYGSNAAGGVVNVITNKGKAKSGANAAAEYGGDGWFRGSFMGTAVEEDGFKAYAGYTRTEEGETPIRTLRSTLGTQVDDYSDKYIGNSYIFGIAKGNWSLSGQTGDSESKWQNSTEEYDRVTYMPTGTFRTLNNRQENKYDRFTFNYNDGKNLGRIYYHLQNRNVLDISGYTEYGDQTIGATYNRHQDIGKLPVVFGMDFRREMADYSNTDNPYGNNDPYNGRRNEFAPYLETSIPIGVAQLDFGLRYEYWNVQGADNQSELMPRISLNYTANNGNIWYATVGRFFSMPSFFQMFYQDASGTTEINPNLKPEYGWTYDLGLKNAQAKNPWSLNLYFMAMKDKINYESFQTATGWKGSYMNADEYKAWGFEGSYKWKFADGWSYTQVLSYLNAEDKYAGQDWKRSPQPRWNVSGILNYNKNHWNGELTAQYYADRVLENTLYEDNNIFLVNGAVGWQNKGLSVRLSCINLFNQQYFMDNQGYFNAERRVILKVSKEF